METINIFISACVTVLALCLMFLTLSSYKKYKNQKLLFVVIVFFIFFMQGLILSLNLFYANTIFSNSDIYLGVMDILVLILLFIAMIKR